MKERIPWINYVNFMKTISEFEQISSTGWEFMVHKRLFFYIYLDEYKEGWTLKIFKQKVGHDQSAVSSSHSDPYELCKYLDPAKQRRILFNLDLFK